MFSYWSSSVVLSCFSVMCVFIPKGSWLLMESTEFLRLIENTRSVGGEEELQSKSEQTATEKGYYQIFCFRSDNARCLRGHKTPCKQQACFFSWTPNPLVPPVGLTATVPLTGSRLWKVEPAGHFIMQRVAVDLGCRWGTLTFSKPRPNKRHRLLFKLFACSWNIKTTECKRREKKQKLKKGDSESAGTAVSPTLNHSPLGLSQPDAF